MEVPEPVARYGQQQGGFDPQFRHAELTEIHGSRP